MANNPTIIDLSMDTPLRKPLETRPKLDKNADFIVLLSSDGVESSSAREEQLRGEDRPAKRRRSVIEEGCGEVVFDVGSDGGVCEGWSDAGSRDRSREESSSARHPNHRLRGESSGPEHDLLPRMMTTRSSLRRVKTVALDGSDPMPWSSSPLPEIFDAERDDRVQSEKEGVAGVRLSVNTGRPSTARVRSLEDTARPSTAQAGSALSFSERTLAILANLNGDDSLRESDQLMDVRKKGKGVETGKFPNRRRSARLETIDEGRQEISVTAASSRPKRGPNKLTETEKQTKADAKARREQDKQAEKQRKQQIKEEKAREKQRASELAQANRSKTDKKASTPEMIVDFPESVRDTDLGKHVESFLRNLGVEMSFSVPPISNVIRWRRKVTAEYNSAKGYWEPVEEYIKDEKQALCVMNATEFVELVCVDANQIDGQDLDAHVLRFKSRFEGYRLLYLIEGLEKWMRKNKNVRNRAYQAAVLAADGEEEGEEHERARGRARKKPRKPPQQEYVNEDTIEDALLRLQVMQGCFVHHTANAIETAEWIGIFTQHVSTVPYRQERMLLPTSFCMESGQIKTGVDPKDTYIKMLQQVVRVTAPIANGIAGEYPNVSSLVDAFREKGPLVLQNLKKRANQNGAFTNTNLGPAVSRRLCAVFTGRDPGSYDI